MLIWLDCIVDFSFWVCNLSFWIIGGSVDVILLFCCFLCQKLIEWCVLTLYLHFSNYPFFSVIHNFL
jgi:hypothetical protein